jgi:hypothetical protein
MDANDGIQTAKPLNFSSTDCAVDGVPHIDIPGSYMTYSGFGGTIGFNDENGDEEDFSGYDLRVQQPVPIMVQMRRPVANGAVIEPLLFCLAPDEVVDGSREPESEFPPNGAGSLHQQVAFVYAGAILGTSALLLW